MTARPAIPRVAGVAALACFVLALLGWASPSAHASATYEGSSADADRVFFSTNERILESADSDNFSDIYQRRGTVTSLISFGPFGGNRPFHAVYGGNSTDGTRVFFTTDERLVQSDPDSATDVYERALGVTTLVSQGSLGGGAFNAIFRAASSDGSRVLFSTDEKLQPTDTDNLPDIYVRTAGVTTLVTPGTAAEGVEFHAASSDATHIFFSTAESLIAGDADSSTDIYESTGGVVSLVSFGPDGGSAEVPPVFGQASQDGTRVWFETTESLVAADSDSNGDVYERSGGATTLVSESATAGDGAFDASFVGHSADGTHAYFETAESLDPADTDDKTDVYDRSGGSTTLVSTSDVGGNGAFDASFDAATPDGSRAFFTTAESLHGNDTDGSPDIYMRTAGNTFLVSPGSAEVAAVFEANSADGTRVLLTTTESLAAEDTDSNRDVYERSGFTELGVGTTTLISTGDGETNFPFDASLAAATPDFATAFIETGERLTLDDTDNPGDIDVFAVSAGVTVLKTAGGQVGPTVNEPFFNGSDPGSPSSDETPLIKGVAPNSSLVRLYTNSGCAGDPIGTGTATTFFSPGIEITVTPDTSTPIYGTATDANGNTSECSSAPFVYIEDSTAPSPPAITNSDPASPANNHLPKFRGSTDAATTVQIYLSADCTGTAGSGTESEFEGAGLTVQVPENQTSSISATATDAAGNVSACSIAFTYTEDSSPAEVPLLTSTTPPSPADDNTPLIKGTAPAGSTVELFKTVGCTGTPAATGTAAALAGDGIEVTVANDDTTAIRATATSQAGNVSPCSAPITYVEDSTAPGAPSLSLGSRARSNDNRVLITGQTGANALVYIFRGINCQGTSVGGGTAQQLAAGIPLTVADNTTVELHAVAVDPARNASPCSSAISYTEDSTKPKTRITFGPAFKTRDRTPTFRFLDESADPTTYFECKVDRKKFRRCKSPKTFKGLRPGRHTIKVRARDTAGNKEARAVKRKFKIVR